MLWWVSYAMVWCNKDWYIWHSMLRHITWCSKSCYGIILYHMYQNTFLWYSIVEYVMYERDWCSMVKCHLWHWVIKYRTTATPNKDNIMIKTELPLLCIYENTQWFLQHWVIQYLVCYGMLCICGCFVSLDGPDNIVLYENGQGF